MKFSHRIGITPVKSMQIEGVDIELRNSLWSIFVLCFIDSLNSSQSHVRFLEDLWFKFYKLPIDTIPSHWDDSKSYIKKRFFNFQWFEVYDFLEFIANLDLESIPFEADVFKDACNIMLERENAGYRFIDYKIAPIINVLEMNEIEEAINISGHFTALNGANIHLKNSLDKISDKKNPDYRNSIKESISAVESVAKKMSNNKNDTLGGALDKIKGKAKIHPALERGFKQLYGYTSDSDGIRHALMEEANCDFEDAKFMLVSCSAFINYLVVKADKAGIELNQA
ncbi:MAG: hypothetical protein H7Y04_08060 [Verrucomicrobia bacterium]|nr:hypothetical protein [Cytophagales bacterium]